MKEHENGLKERIANLSARELKRILKEESQEYTRQAIKIIKQELKIRELSKETQDKDKFDVGLTQEPKKLKLPKSIQNIITAIAAIALFVFLFFLTGPRSKYWAPEKGEYGTRRLTWFELFKEDPNKIFEYIGISLVVVIIYFVARAIIKKFKNDWM